MNYILDTHTLIWFLEGDRQLSEQALSIIEDSSKLKCVSIASLWEIGIKISIGKLGLRRSFQDFLHDFLQTDITILAVDLSHILRVSQMRLIHRDPFDRMIIAQALENSYTILGQDPQFLAYNVDMVWI